MRRAAGRSRGLWRLAWLLVGFALLQAAWVVATQPFGGPDEPSHYLRALTLVNGQLIGPKVPYPSGLSPEAQAFADHDTTAVLVPANLAPYEVNCGDGKPDLSGSCYEVDPNGNFPPLPYLLPAVAISISHDYETADWRARIASVVPALAFLLLAAVLLWNGTAWSLLGLLAATSPMVLFTSSVLNASGLQITGCLAFAAAALRIARAPGGTPTWVWAAFAVSGAVAILAGPIGLEFALFDLLVFALVLGRRGISDVVLKANGWVLFWTAGALLAAAVLALIYNRIAGFSATFRIFPLWTGISQGLDQMPSVLRDAVGTFGALILPLPLAARWVWWLLVVALLLTAMWLGNRRERLLVAGVTVLGLAFPVFFYAWIDRFSGFGLQGREVLPALMLIPLVAGEVVARNSPRIADRLPARLALAGAIALFAGFQAYAWWYDVSIVTTTRPELDFYRNAAYLVPMGWPFWIAVAVLGSGALLAFATSEEADLAPAAQPIAG